MRSLKGKTLFITGASRGIGRAIALRAAADAHPVLRHSVGAMVGEPRRHEIEGRRQDEDIRILGFRKIAIAIGSTLLMAGILQIHQERAAAYRSLSFSAAK
jgi:NAD(P)-dependent dehydrogenase (short-subunit alcohol dehydrogenase family)